MSRSHETLIKKKRILVIEREIPYPQYKSGNSVITFPILKYLGNVYDIDLICPHEQNSEAREWLKALQPFCRKIYTYAFNKPFLGKLLISIIHPFPLIFALYSRKEFERYIYALIKDVSHEYSAVLVRDTHIARFSEYFRIRAHTKLIFISPDYYGLLFKRTVVSQGFKPKLIYNFLSYLKLLYSEPAIYKKFDHVVYVSSDDKKYFARHHPDIQDKIVVIPIGLELENYKYEVENPVHDKLTKTESMVFTGNMDYEPNQQAVTWFYNNVFVALKKRRQSLRWDIVGHRANEYFNFHDPQIRIHTSVPSIIPYLQAATIVLSPLQSGSGLKNKVIEAMACRKVVIGSNLSFHGIPFKQGEHGFIASSPEDYIAFIEKILDDAAERTRIENAAFDLVNREFAMEHIMGLWRTLIEAGD